MDKLFDTVLELSWQAGLIALAVMAVRLVLRKKASRRALCILWALVALRLLLPVSLTVESPVSLQAEEAPVSRAYHAMQETRTSVPEEAAPAPAESSGAAAAVVPTEPAAEPVTLWTFARWLPWIWVIGMGCMAAYMLLSFIWMRLTLRRAEHIRDNVYRCTQWSTPFVLGIIAPCIYVPESVSEEDLPQVLAHERCHIRRWDHVVKPFAFLLLAVNWFNPVLWAAYVLLGRDMENACDEMALKNADAAQRAAYSRALVSCAAQPKMAAVCPLAFGEVAVKERVKNVLGYKKPAIWAAVILAAAAVVIGVCLLTKPSYKNVGTLDAEKLFALRTPYVDNNSAVGAILDALGFRELGSSGADYGYAVHLSTDKEPMGITVLYTYEGAVPRKSEERYRQIAMRGYIALALIDNAEWFSWQEHGADGTSNKADSTASDSLYPIVYPGYPDTVRESAEGLQAYINMLQEWMKDGVVPYAYGSGERDVWAWNADRLDEYRWKWGLSEAALYDDVMRLGMQTRASMAGYDCRAQITTEEDSTGVDVFLYPMSGDATAEEIDGELATWMRGALHMMLALNDKAQWARFSTVDADNGAHCWGRAFADASAYDIAGARESREGLEKLIKALQDDIERGQVGESFAMMEDGAEVPSAAPASPLGTSGESAYIVKFRRPAAELEVYQITWGAGDSTKQVVPLREEQVQAIQSEKGLVQPEWYQVCAELRQGDEDVAYYMGTDYKPVPPTVLKILTEQCGYTFVTPEDFRGNMTSAKLEFYDGETYTADKADLPALQRMLTNARAYGGGAACGFGAKLTVTFDDGRTVSVLKGTDSCASFTFGSWNTAMVSDSENRQFWQIFGVPFEG